MAINRYLSFIMAAIALFSAGACSKPEDVPPQGRTEILKVVASIFPVYDFAKNIGGSDADITLLLPPGSEPHSFEPKPADIVRINRADIFIYTNRYMEPWAEVIQKGTDNSRVTVVDAGSGINIAPGRDNAAGRKMGKGPHGHMDQARSDPHIWLDFGNAEKMVDTITSAFIAKDPQNRDQYLANAAAYKARLQALDVRFKNELSGCSKNIVIDGGHYTFGYLAKRYGLNYVAAYGISPDAEPSARNLVQLSRMLKKHDLKYLFHEELLSPRVADTIAKETGAGLLKLHGAHNVSMQELVSGSSFIDLMERNLENLKKGLQCR